MDSAGSSPEGGLQNLLLRQISLLEDAANISRKLLSDDIIDNNLGSFEQEEEFYVDVDERDDKQAHHRSWLDKLPALKLTSPRLMAFSESSSPRRSPREARHTAAEGNILVLSAFTSLGQSDEQRFEQTGLGEEVPFETLPSWSSQFSNGALKTNLHASFAACPAGVESDAASAHSRSESPRISPKPLAKRHTYGVASTRTRNLRMLLGDPLLPPDASISTEAFGTASRTSIDQERPTSSNGDRKTKDSHRHTLHEETAIRKKLKEVLQEEVGDDEFLYKRHGLCQKIVKDLFFQISTLVVVLLNVIWLGIDTNYNKAEVLCLADPIFQVMENAFCTFFVFELVVRAGAHQEFLRALMSPVFLFDAFLCMTMVWETWVQVLIFKYSGERTSGLGGANALRILRIFRITRITRVARMARLVRLFPELMILVRGMAAGMRSVAAILFLLFIIIYIFGIIFTQMDTFSDVPGAMEFLLTQVLCGFEPEFMDKMLAAGAVHYITFLFYALLASFTLMNMLIGFICQVVGEVAETAKEERLVKDFEGEIETIATALGLADRGFSMSDIMSLRHHPEYCKGLINLGVDFVSFMNLLKLFLPDDGEELPLEDVKQLLSHCRATKAVTVKDLVDHQRFLHLELNGIRHAINKVAEGEPINRQESGNVYS